MSISFDFNYGIRKTHMFFHDIEYIKIDKKNITIKGKFEKGTYQYQLRHCEDIHICQ